MVYLSIVIPTYNESKVIKNSMEKIISELNNSKDFEIIIADNASNDDTFEIACNLTKKYRQIKPFHISQKGRGIALKTAFKKAKGEILLYMDADLASNLKHMKQLIQKIEEGYDLATGSRLMKESKVIGRLFSREIASRIYNLLVRLLFKTGIRDHQCGFKAFRKKSIIKIIDEVKDTKWFWDTETIVKSKMKGFKIAEIPVKWIDSKYTSVSMKQDVIEMGLSLLFLYFELK